MPASRPGLISFFARAFGRGLLVLVPLVGTLWVFGSAVSALDAALGAPFPGFGVLVIVPAVFGVGLLTGNVLGAALVRGFELLVGRLPLVRLVYTSLKDLLSAFVGEKKGFDRPVAAALDEAGAVLVLGFQTSDHIPGLPGHVAVYLPQAYNFAGNVVVVPAARVRPLPADPAAVMGFIVSGGVGHLEGRAQEASTSERSSASPTLP